VLEVYRFLVIVPHFVDKLICMLTLFFFVYDHSES